MDTRGAYTARRAAALSGVPISTVHYWAREDILCPSVSPDKVKLWSYADLMGLRIIYWLRSEKDGPEGTIRRSSMPTVKRALKQLSGFADADLWSVEHGSGLRVDRSGRVYVWPRSEEPVHDWQVLLGREVIDLAEPFPTSGETKGPDLRAPRPTLRILPGKLSGAPHVEATRIETESLWALRSRGFSAEIIRGMYPGLEAVALREALDLEAQLQRNLRGHRVAA